MEDTEKRYNSVLEIIDKRLIADETAKGARGEVFTPLNLAREMLFGLRKSTIENFKGKMPHSKKKEKDYLQFIWGINKDDGEFFDDKESDRIGGIPLSVWRNPNTKWLDPANGIGNFPVVAFYMLNYQLGKHGPSNFRGEANAKKRKEHIVKNMLYMIEIDKGNVNSTIKIFKLMVPGVKPNICCADTLKMTDARLKSEFGVNRFDVVMGNPPYNQGGTKTTGEKGLYKKFIMYGFNLLEKNGYLIYVHPPNFHRIDKDDTKKEITVKKIFNDNNLLFLRIIPDTKVYFDVQIAIDYYILQNKSNEKKADILDENNFLTNDINIALFNIVPNFGFNVIKKLEALQKKYGVFEAKVGRDSSHDQRRIIKGKLKIVHYINNDGMRIFLSEKPHEYQNTKKVIVNGLGVPYVLNDKDGKYGVSEGPYYIIEPSNKEKIFLFSKLFQYLCLAYKIQGNKNDMFLFDILPNLNKINFTTEESMMNALGFNEKDKTEIEKYKVPTFLNVEKIEIPGEGKAKTAKAPKAKGGAPKTHTRKRKPSEKSWFF